MSITPQAVQKLLDEVERSRASRKRAWDNLQEITNTPQGLSFQRRPEKDVFPAKWVPLRYKHLLDEFPIPTRGSSPGRPFLHPEKLEAALLMVEAGLWPTKAPPETGYGRSTLYREIQARDHA